MNTLDLNAYGVEEMNVTETKSMNGGCWFLIAVLVVGLIFATDGNPDTNFTVNGYDVEF